MRETKTQTPAVVAWVAWLHASVACTTPNMNRLSRMHTFRWQHNQHATRPSITYHQRTATAPSNTSSTSSLWPKLTCTKYTACSCRKLLTIGTGWMSPWLAIIWRRLSPSTLPGITQTIVEGLADSWCHKSVEGRLAIGYGGQFHFSGRPHNPTSRFWSSQTSVVTAESFSDRSGPL